MANIKLTLPGAPFTGQIVTFIAHCNCDEVTDGLVIGEDIYTVVDANGCCATGKGGRWKTGAIVSVTLDVENKEAYILNADTNDYLEDKIEGVRTIASSKAPMYSYGTADLTAGSTGLPTGTMHLVYE